MFSILSTQRTCSYLRINSCKSQTQSTNGAQYDKCNVGWLLKSYLNDRDLNTCAIHKNYGRNFVFSENKVFQFKETCI